VSLVDDVIDFVAPVVAPIPYFVSKPEEAQKAFEQAGSVLWPGLAAAAQGMASGIVIPGVTPARGGGGVPAVVPAAAGTFDRYKVPIAIGVVLLAAGVAWMATRKKSR
jgi:hypothetical protein